MQLVDMGTVREEGLGFGKSSPVPSVQEIVRSDDSMEAWSNGKYKSIEHRAIVNVEKPRISVATFVIPGNDIKLNPVETMMDDDLRPRIFKNGVKFVEYLRYILAKKMEGKSANIKYVKLDQ